MYEVKGKIMNGVNELDEGLDWFVDLAWEVIERLEKGINNKAYESLDDIRMFIDNFDHTSIVRIENRVYFDNNLHYAVMFDGHFIYSIDVNKCKGLRV